ncbi:MAG: trehalose biosynthesis protein, partial [Brachybacterium sp.]
MADARSTALLDMTLLPPLGEVLDLAAAQLAAWMPQQRWYAHKGAGAPQVEVAGWAPLRIAPDHVSVLLVAAVHLGDEDRPAAGGAADGSVGSGSDGAPVAPGTAPGAHPGPAGSRAPDALYQVPLVLRRPEGAPAPEEGAEIGVLAVAGGPLRVDDATRDADGRAALVATLVSGDGAAGPGLSLASHRTHPGSPLPLGRAMRSRVLAGEQSNTSLIIETEGASPLIVKLFRVLQDGENPDAALQGALTAQGSAHVPAVVGAATVRTGAMRTHALVAQEFLPQVEDAWRVTLRLARAGEDFTAPARALGTTLAEVHRDLAAAFGTVAADEGAVRTVIAQMHGRLAQVAAEVEQVAAHREPLAALLDAAAGQ